MTERPRIAVVGYGSILNLDDVASTFEAVEERVSPVRVSGFKRIFNQEASWRETADEERAVLNVVPAADSWFNGVVVTDLTRREFRDLRERERGYRLIEVEPDQIEPYDPREIPTDEVEVSLTAWEDQDLILTTTGKKVDDGIAPIPDYVEICKTGARTWGDVFYEEFLETTETNDGASLAAESE